MEVMFCSVMKLFTLDKIIKKSFIINVSSLVAVLKPRWNEVGPCMYNYLFIFLRLFVGFHIKITAKKIMQFQNLIIPYYVDLSIFSDQAFFYNIILTLACFHCRPFIFESLYHVFLTNFILNKYYWQLNKNIFLKIIYLRVIKPYQYLLFILYTWVKFS